MVKNTAPFIGMGSFFDDRDYKAVWVSALNNVLVENNIIDSAGLSGIQFQGNNVLIQQNLSIIIASCWMMVQAFTAL